MEDESRWWNEETVAVVTGANKGIGWEVCRQLAEQGLRVVLTARDKTRGQEALHALTTELGLHNIYFHHLDVQDDQSVAALASWLQHKFSSIDILINNAAVSGVMLDQEYLKKNKVDPIDLLLNEETNEGFIIEYESAKACIDANYYGAKRVTKALMSLLRGASSGGARVISVGSSFGQLCHLQSVKLKEELTDINNLSEEYIDKILDSYLEDVQSKSLDKKLWPLKFPSYKMSKIALHAHTRVLAKELEMMMPHGNRIFINCVHPGHVRTDLTSHQGELTPAEGANNIVRVALLPPQKCPSGAFFFEHEIGSFVG